MHPPAAAPVFNPVATFHLCNENFAQRDEDGPAGVCCSLVNTLRWFRENRSSVLPREVQRPGAAGHSGGNSSRGEHVLPTFHLLPVPVPGHRGLQQQQQQQFLLKRGMIWSAFKPTHPLKQGISTQQVSGLELTGVYAMKT